MTMFNTVSKAKRAALSLAAFAGFILSVQNSFAQVPNTRAAESNIQVRPCRNGPLEKNLMPLNTLPCGTRPADTKELTSRQVKKLAAAAKSPDDHLTVARYYRMKADQLDAQAAQYEEAAAALEHGPAVKNLTAPTTAPRYQYFAKKLRGQATLDRTMAGSQDQIAQATAPAQMSAR